MPFPSWLNFGPAYPGWASMESRFEDISAPRWRVFVSSASLHLDGFRNAAREVIANFRYAGLECFEPVMMEDFGARDGQAREVCANAVRGCDILVGIIGIRYGSHPPDDLTSYTELEFQTAVEHGLSRLMFVLNREVAAGLEQDGRQNQGQADRQEAFRKRVAEDRVCVMDVTTVEQFRERLAEALRRWVDEDSFKRVLVDHGAAFSQARRRLVNLGLRNGGAALVFGEPGTGKTKVIEMLLEDFLLRRSYAHLAGPVTVRMAEGYGAVEQARMEITSILHSLAGQSAGERADLDALLPVLGAVPVLITLFLETGDAAEIVDARALGALPGLFTWDPLRAVVLAETNNHSVRNRLARELRWPAEAVVTVRDYDDVSDALEQMRRDAPGVPQWPSNAATLAQALGLRPISLRDVATYIDQHAGGNPRRAAFLVRELLNAIAHEQTPERRYEALIRDQVDHLSQEARDLLALMTVLHPKPTLFPDEMAVALDLSLGLEEAVRLATTDARDEDAADEDPRDRADGLVAELVGRGLLERYPRLRPGQASSAADGRPAELLTLHSTKRAIIGEHLPLTPELRAEGHARAEAFYRSRVGDSVGGSFESHFRLEDEAWWDDAQEWFYHLGHIDPEKAGIRFATLFLDEFWWWDLYVPSDLCASLLAYGERPLVRAISPDMTDVVALLTRFRRTWPRQYDVARTQILAEVAGAYGVPAGLRDIADRGAQVVDVLRDLCRRLRIDELDSLFADATPLPGVNDTAPVPLTAAGDPTVTDEERRHHLLGLICGFLGEAHRYQSLADASGRALGAAALCERHALAHFLAGGDDWEASWTRYEFGVIVSRRGGDPVPLWDQAAVEADAQGDCDLLACIERARADHLRSRGKPDEALEHFGRSVFYGLAEQIAESVTDAADKCTQAAYREFRSHAAKVLAEALLRDQGTPLAVRVAEAGRRLEVMLAQWGGTWTPDADDLAAAFRSASLEAAEATVDAIGDAAFPPGPDDAVLGFPLTDYYRQVRDLVRRTRTQPWVKMQSRLDALLRKFTE